MYEQVLSGMRDGVMVLDEQDRIIYANPALAEIFLTSLEEIQGKKLLEAARLVELSDLVEAAKKEASAQEKEIKFFYPEDRFFLCLVNTVKEKDGKILGLAVILRDISEMKKLENLRREFVANVSHELKTPLTAIRSYVETLLNGAINDPSHNRKFLEKINKNALELSALIEDILEVSRLEYRRKIPVFVMVDLHSVVAKVIEAEAKKAEAKKIQVIKNCPAGKVEVKGDEEHIYRALLNLVDNAINYSSAGGNVEIYCEAKEGRFALSVKDSGIGIALEHLERIFERFYRVDPARSRDAGGTGLGLSIVKHIMDLHNGSVTVESEAGKGTVFTLSFPQG